MVRKSINIWPIKRSVSRCLRPVLFTRMDRELSCVFRLAVNDGTKPNRGNKGTSTIGFQRDALDRCHCREPAFLAASYGVRLDSSIAASSGGLKTGGRTITTLLNEINEAVRSSKRLPSSIDRSACHEGTWPAILFSASKDLVSSFQ